MKSKVPKFKLKRSWKEEEVRKKEIKQKFYKKQKVHDTCVQRDTCND